MRFEFDDEQQALRDAVRGLFERHAPLDRTRDGFGEQAQRSLWARMTELELPGLHFPDAAGGTDATLLELSVVLMEAGRILLPGPLLASAGLAACLLRAGDPENATGPAARLASGAAIGAAAVRSPQLRITGTGDRLRLTGGTGPVLSGDISDLLVLVRDDDREHPLIIVDLRGAGVRRRLTRGVDPSREFAEFAFTDAEAAAVPADPVAVDRALAAAALCLAAEQVGAAEAVLRMTVDYALVRHQFGRPIGSFQAVKHRCADMFVDVERARTAVLVATAEHIGDHADPVDALLAAQTASRSFGRVARSAVQVHGAIGFTWEHDVPRFLKRALSTAALVAGFAPIERAARSLDPASEAAA
ncbi:acyl-CoA dehydrogenase family protein [Nocardia sp. R6R-6]|uniref:acyl-CoA dehydrogenase family protein n=1 Tax=Nocardia sp. R6R-6 TaxID=3459303 RepID=UPI00403DCBA9